MNSEDEKPLMSPFDAPVVVDSVSLPSLELAAAQNPAFAYLRSLGSRKSQRTMYSFLNRVAYLVNESTISDFDWGALRRHHIHGVIGLLRESGRAPTTINTYLSALKGVALEAWTLRKMDTESFQHIKLIKSVKGYRIPRGRALDWGEMGALFAVCQQDESPKGLRDAAILAVLIGCGLRRSEIVSLDLEQVSSKEQSLTILGKGNKERLSFMPPATWVRLKAYLDEVRGDLPGALFQRIRRFGVLTNERMTDQAIYHILGTRRLEAGVASFAPHDLRRSFATMMFENGEDIVTVKDAMGHASVVTTQQYDKRPHDRLKKAAQTLRF